MDFLASERSSLDPRGNVINVLPTALAPVDLCQSYWPTLQSLECKSLAYFRGVRTSKIGCNFVGETVWYQ
jgi:hypothetical protein